MPSTTALLRDLDPDDVRTVYVRRRLDTLPDTELVDAAAAVIGRPKETEPNSFVLHAPLELLARAALLDHVSPGVRHDVRLRIAWLAATYDAAGPGITVTPAAFRTETAAVAALVDAIGAGEIAVAGAIGSWLGRNVDAPALTAAIGDAVVPSLAAAAHGPIFLHHLQRVASRSPVAGSLFANLARDLARHPGWELTWMDRARRADGDLVAALAATPVLGPPASNFIYPLMDQAESSGLAAEIAGGAVGPATDIRAATIAIVRVATASMLLDDPAQAPYGWSHCLTIPQSVAAVAPLLADPSRAIAVAATQVVGFRAGLGTAPLTALAGDALAPDGLLDTPPPDPASLQGVIDRAAVHPDAHRAKYVVACLDAARTDPDGAAQHRAAAARLDAWWREHPVGDDPILALAGVG